MGPDDLTAVECRVWEAFARGETVDLTSGDPDADDPARADRWGAERVVRAEVVTALLAGAQKPQPGQVPALRLTGARIEGFLDLNYAHVGCHVRLKDCSIPESVYLWGAHTRQISLLGSWFGGDFEASLAAIDGNLRLTGARVAGHPAGIETHLANLASGELDLMLHR